MLILICIYPKVNRNPSDPAAGCAHQDQNAIPAFADPICVKKIISKKISIVIVGTKWYHFVLFGNIKTQHSR